MRLPIDSFPTEKTDQVNLIYQWLVNYPDVFSNITVRRDMKYLEQHRSNYLGRIYKTMHDCVAEYNTQYQTIKTHTSNNLDNEATNIPDKHPESVTIVEDSRTMVDEETEDVSNQSPHVLLSNTPDTSNNQSVSE